MRILRKRILDLVASRGFTVIKTSILASERAELRTAHERLAVCEAGAAPAETPCQSPSPPGAEAALQSAWDTQCSVDGLLDQLWAARAHLALTREQERAARFDLEHEHRLLENEVDVARRAMVEALADLDRERADHADCVQHGQATLDAALSKLELAEAETVRLTAAWEHERAARFDLESEYQLLDYEADVARQGKVQALADLERERADHADTAGALEQIQIALDATRSDLDAQHAARIALEAELEGMRQDVACIRAELDQERQNHTLTSHSLTQTTAAFQTEQRALNELRLSQGTHQNRVIHLLENRVIHLLEAVWARGTSNKAYFNLITYGRTATHWIAKALSLHPDIVCAHGPELSPYRRDETEIERTARHHRDADRIATMNLDEYYDILEQRDLKVYGVVHGITDFGPTLRPDLYRRRYHIAAITRHPVTRAQSFATRWLFEYNNIEADRAEMMARASERLAAVRARKIPIPPAAKMSLADKIFVSATLWMLTTEPVKVANIPSYRMEDIVGSRDGFAGFFTEVTQGAIPLEQGYIDAVMALPHQDSLAEVATPEVTFASWPEWKQRLVVTILEQERLDRRYEELGYDLSFLRP